MATNDPYTPLDVTPKAMSDAGYSIIRHYSASKQASSGNYGNLRHEYRYRVSYLRRPLFDEGTLTKAIGAVKEYAAQQADPLSAIRASLAEHTEKARHHFEQAAYHAAEAAAAAALLAAHR